MNKKCSSCKKNKPLSQFHKQPSGKHGRHSWCKECFNEKAKRYKKRKCPEGKRKHNLKTRYDITQEEYISMLNKQKGKCAICKQAPQRPVVDHCHNTRKVRGILCHACNIKLPAIEDKSYMKRAITYLKRSLQ
jgi:hypothetical protein